MEDSQIRHVFSALYVVILILGVVSFSILFYVDRSRGQESIEFFAFLTFYSLSNIVNGYRHPLASLLDLKTRLGNTIVVTAYCVCFSLTLKRRYYEKTFTYFNLAIILIPIVIVNVASETVKSICSLRLVILAFVVSMFSLVISAYYLMKSFFAIEALNLRFVNYQETTFFYNMITKMFFVFCHWVVFLLRNTDVLGLDLPKPVIRAMYVQENSFVVGYFIVVILIGIFRCKKCSLLNRYSDI